MGKNTEFFFTFSENLTKTTAPAFKWIVKHFVAILAVLAVILFVWRSIIHHFIHNVPIGRSLATAGLEIIVTYIICLLGGFIVYLIFKLVSAWLTTASEKRTRTRETTEMTNNEQPAETTSPELEKIDADILRAYLNTRRMDMPYREGGNTVFDELVNVLGKMLKLYRKGSKSEICFSDKDFIQVATILYDRKYQNTQKTTFNEWCRSLFKAMNLEEPKDIKKAKRNDFGTKVLKAMSFLPKDNQA